MKIVLKEIFLCALVAVVSFVLFIVLGTFYDSRQQNTFVNIVVWLAEGLISFFVVFIPIYIKKKSFFFDGFALASAYLVIVVACLTRQYSFNEYLYLDALVFMSSLLTLVEIITRVLKHGDFVKRTKTIPGLYIDKINQLDIWEQKPLKIIVLSLLENESISLKEASLVTKVGERKTRIILKDSVSVGLLQVNGNTINKRYKLINDLNIN